MALPETVDEKSFSYRDLLSKDEWSAFTPSFGSLTVVGATSYTGRYRIVGSQLQFQVKFSAATSIASSAGTDYLTLPKTANGSAGVAVMTDNTAKTAVGVCHIDVANSRCYLPTQTASAHVFTLCGSYEI